MKKLLLSIGMLGFTTLGFSQVVFNVTAPSNLLGVRDMTFAKPTDGWGTPDLMIPANYVEDTLVFAGDGTAADSLNCGATTSPDVAGNIAVIYRGACEFGTKALNAYNAGAKAVVLINNIPGAPIEMAPGADGASALIPVVMISKADGAALRDSILTKSVVAFIGNKQGYFADDIGINDSSIVRTRSSSLISLVTQNASEFSVTPGAWVTASGSNDGLGTTVNCKISFGGSVIYDQTSVAQDIPSGDSLFIGLPTFSQATYAKGKYDMTYTVQMTAADQDPFDNMIEADFYINDSIFAYSKTDSATLRPDANAYYRPSDPSASDVITNYQPCVYFRNPNADRLALTGITFSATTGDTNVELTGQYIEFYLYNWNDVFADYTSATFDQVVLNQQTDYTFNGDYQDSNITVSFLDPIQLSNDQRYLVCASVYGSDIYIGFDASTDYTQNISFEEMQFLYPIQISSTSTTSTWYGLGFGADVVPAMSLEMMDASFLGIKEENEKSISITPYPNPTVNELNIPMYDMQGSAHLRVVDLNGKTVMNRKVDVQNEVLKVDVSSLSNGTYIFNMNFSNGKSTQFRVAVNK